MSVRSGALFMCAAFVCAQALGFGADKSTSRPLGTADATSIKKGPKNLSQAELRAIRIRQWHLHWDPIWTGVLASSLRFNLSVDDFDRIEKLKVPLRETIRKNVRVNGAIAKSGARAIDTAAANLKKSIRALMKIDDRHTNGLYCDGLKATHSSPTIVSPNLGSVAPYKHAVRMAVGSGVIVGRRVVLTAAHNLPLAWLQNPTSALSPSPFHWVNVYKRFFGNPVGYAGSEHPPADIFGTPSLPAPRYIIPLENMRAIYAANMHFPEVANGSTGINAISGSFENLKGLDYRDNDDIMVVVFDQDIASDDEIAPFRNLNHAALLGTNAQKLMLGFPRSFYAGRTWPSSQHPNLFKLHQTGPSTDRFTNRIVAYPQALKNSFFSCDMAAFGGNSGGPLFVRHSGRWVLSGILTNGSPHSSNGSYVGSGTVGVRVIDAEIVELIDRARSLAGEIY